jgi:hypothetical protein
MCKSDSAQTTNTKLDRNGLGIHLSTSGDSIHPASRSASTSKLKAESDAGPIV